MAFSLFAAFFSFYIYGALGWVYETTFVSITHHKFINRGFLNGPFIPIYGFGGAGIYLTFYNSKMYFLAEKVTYTHIIVIFVIGMILASILEYAVSYLMEVLFHAKLWDYSDYPLNLNGRISLRSSLLWGFFATVGVYSIQPCLLYWIDHISRPFGDYLLGFLILVTLADLTVTVNASLQLPKKLDAISRVQEILYEYSSGLYWYDLTEEIKNKIKNTKLNELVTTYRNSRANEHVYRRIFQAFPRMKMSGREQRLEEFKTKIHTLRRKN